MPTKEIQLDAKTIAIAKQRLVEERQARVPGEAVGALAALKTRTHRPNHFLNHAISDDSVALIGQIRQGSVYDPVAKTLSYTRFGVDAVSLYTDDRIYSKGMDDLLLTSLSAPDTPIVCQNYILNEYHVTEARAAGASAVVAYSSILDRQTLRQVVSLTLRWRMTSIVQIGDADELDYAVSLSPHVIGVGVDQRFVPERDIPLLEMLRPLYPYNSRVMTLGCIDNYDDLQTAVDLGMNAVVVDDTVINDPASSYALQEILRRD